jgi:hypothetical protein
MKHLHELSFEQKTRLLAELDGWDSLLEKDGSLYGRPPINRKFDSEIARWIVPNYLISYDAIIPLREKVINTPELKVTWLNTARKIVGRRLGTDKVSDFDIACLKPDEDCDAVLVATGKAIV